MPSKVGEIQGIKQPSCEPGEAEIQTPPIRDRRRSDSTRIERHSRLHASVRCAIFQRSLRATSAFHAEGTATVLQPASRGETTNAPTRMKRKSYPPSVP
jgi:hypothetical protein